MSIERYIFLHPECFSYVFHDDLTDFDFFVYTDAAGTRHRVSVFADGQVRIYREDDMSSPEVDIKSSAEQQDVFYFWLSHNYWA